MKTRILLLLASSCFSLLLQAQSYTKQIKSLDKFIVEGINKWQPPALAVTVVKNGEIVFTRSYGVTNITTKQPVDNNTLFGCMSTTKAFVAAGIALLVDDGKLRWEDKVIDHLPEFQLKDPYLTREITITDLLTHRTGIGNTDYLWSQMDIPGDSILYKMRGVDKSYSLRSSFIYQNIFYLAAGKVIEKVTGKYWGDFLKERIYNPLGMTNTYATMRAIQQITNRADAHYEIDGKITVIEQSNADHIGPAGSMWSSINDIGKWIQFLLNEGAVDGKTLISDKNFKALFKTHQIVPASQFYPTQQVTKPNFRTYGLGWFQHDYKGKMVQFHTGSLAGMVAIAGMIPEDEVGVYVMGNLDHVELRHAIMYAVFDLFTEGKLSRDWSEELYAIYHPDTKPDPEPKPIANTTPTLKETQLIGAFINKQYGWVKIFEDKGALRFNLNDKVYGTLKHWHYNTYQVIFDKKYWGYMLVNINLDVLGNLSHIDIGGDSFYLKK